MPRVRQLKVGLTPMLYTMIRQESKDTGLSMSEIIRNRLIASYRTNLDQLSLVSNEKEIINDRV